MKIKSRPQTERVAKAIVVRIIPWSLVRIQVGPPFLNMLKTFWNKVKNWPFAWVLLGLALGYIAILILVLEYHKSRADDAEAQLTIMKRLVEKHIR